MNQLHTLKIAHLISLDTIGGIERDYSQFINFESEAINVEHHTLLVKTKLASAIKEPVQKGSRSIQRLSAVKGVKIPRWPSSLRRHHRKRVLAKIAPDLILIWSRPRCIDLLEGIVDAPIVYYEHGAAWLKKDGPDDQAVMQRLFQRVAGVICNSQAARRVIELRWAPPAHTNIRVCLNAIRPDCLPAANSFKSLPDSRPLRLGCAGRFMAIKGFPLAIHAVHCLKQRGVACELYLAGTGGELANCRELSKKLGLQGQVEFLGLVKDMSGFFKFVDCFLCPSIREPFGLVCAEAMAHGCPVIASRVDGLPEVVQDGTTGYCIPPELPLDDYRRFGGSLKKMPLYVYNPDRDRLETPNILNPEQIADRVQTIVSSPENFQHMSVAAGQTAFEKFSYRTHAQHVLDALVHIAEYRK